MKNIRERCWQQRSVLCFLDMDITDILYIDLSSILPPLPRWYCRWRFFCFFEKKILYGNWQRWFKSLLLVIFLDWLNPERILLFCDRCDRNFKSTACHRQKKTNINIAAIHKKINFENCFIPKERVFIRPNYEDMWCEQKTYTRKVFERHEKS